MKYIPENLKIVLQSPHELTYEVKGETFTREVRPAFFTDAAASQDVALRWAEGDSYGYRAGVRRLTKKGAKQIVSVPNEPFHELQLVNLVFREEGGRAYKVVTPEGYLVDLREDVVFDLLMSVGAKKGGVFNGNFIWGRNSSQMRIVLVGSTLHQECVEGTQRKKLKKIPNKDLKVGTVYRTKSGKTSIFRGWMQLAGTRKKAMLWYEISWLPDEKSFQDDYSAYGHKESDLARSHSFVEVVGKVSLGANRVRGVRDGWELLREKETGVWYLLEDDKLILRKLDSLQNDGGPLKDYAFRVPRPLSPKVLKKFQDFGLDP